MRKDFFVPSLLRFLKRISWQGTTLVILGFVTLRRKQYILMSSSRALFQDSGRWATLRHYLAYLVSDFFVFFVLVALSGLSTLVKKNRIKYLIFAFALLILILFVIDLVALSTFQSSLSIFDISSGLLDPSVVHINGNIFLSILISCCVVVGAFFLAHSSFFKKHKKMLFALSTFLFAIVCFVSSILYVPGSRFPENIFSKHIRILSERLQQGQSGVDKNSKEYLKSFSYLPGKNKQINVIVVLAESLSAIDSLRVGGVYDHLPYFDKIQTEGVTFTNFLANGCTSDTAHVALLQGVEPWKFSWQGSNAYTGYRVPTSPLGTFAKEQQYDTIFLSTASLNFLDQRVFLSGAGFSNIQGEETFLGEKKYVFSSAPDQSLYKKALKTISEQKDPYIMVMQTISFHKPYDTPYGASQKAALRYTDKSLYYLYQQLKKSGFFENGILIIVGDHRKMEPLEEKEKAALGSLRYARPLLTIVGTGITPNTFDDRIIQHTDIFYSLKTLIGKKDVFVSNIFNDLFSSHAKRDWGLVFCRYFTHRYGITSQNSSGAGFEYVNELRGPHPDIYAYIQSYNAFQQELETTTQKKSDSSKQMIIIGHRGSPSHTTENSLEGFLLAKQHGANGIELDVSQTKDGHNVVLHGPSMYSTTCGTKTMVGSRTLDWLQKNCPLTNGETIKTLDEMLYALSGMFDYYFVELKANTKSISQQTLQAIETVKKLGMEDKVVFTSYDKTATYILGATKGIHAARDTFDNADLNILPHFLHEYYMMPIQNITGSIVQDINDMGKKLVVYTINTRDELELLYHQGVQIILTDDVITMKEYADKLALEEK